jgi:hypothetical protein
MKSKLQANRNELIYFGLGILTGMGLGLRLGVAATIAAGGFYLYRRKRQVTPVLQEKMLSRT